VASKLDIPKEQLTEHDILRRAAAEVLMRDPDVGAEMAGCETAKFVQVARKEFRKYQDQIGYKFTDDDLRDIHEMMRELVVRRAMGGKGLHVNPN
jgi:hypothetical protein